MKNFYKIKISFKMSDKTSMDNIYLFEKIKDCQTTPNEIANCLVGLTKKQFKFLKHKECSIKIVEKSYKRTPKKYLQF